MSKNEKEEEIISIKITMIGDAGVGKTSIVARYIENDFNPESKSTIGANYSKSELIFNNHKVILDIWDTAGQEKFRSMGRHFYKNSNIIVMVYDVTKIDTFEDIKNYWYDDVKENGEKYKVLGLVGNKIDLYDVEGVDEIDEKIIKEFTDKICNDKENKLICMNVSCKTGVNIKNLFDNLISLYFEKEFNNLIKQNSLNKGDTFKMNGGKKKEKKCCS